jgi:zinc protease
VIALSLAISVSASLPGRTAPADDAAVAKLSAAELDKLGVEFVTTQLFSGGQPISEYKLKSNGLSILLGERHATPIACVMVVYHVGSRNEAVGYTGSTHFLEHMMFKGTAKHDPQKGTGVDDVLKPIGGYNNATTFYDRTNYFEIVPSKNIDLCLDLESDRMRNLLLRKEDHDSEMTVVRNELERNEDEPQQLLQQHIFTTAFQEHPYHHPVIGWRSDVENVPSKRLRQFYDEFYWPNNATLMVVGDFKTDEVLKNIVEYFGKIPPAPAEMPDVYTQEPPQEGQRRFIVQKGVELPHVSIAFHAVKARHPDTYALDVLESILGDENSKSSRLYKGLIDTGLASEADASNTSLRDPGLFVLTATVSAQTKPEQAEKALLAEIDKLRTTPPDREELDRAKQSIIKKLKLIYSEPVSMAEQMAEGIAVADWRWLSDYPEKIKAVTAEDVQRVVKRYCTEPNMTVGYYLPNPEQPESEKLADSDSMSTSAPAASETAAKDKAPAPKPAATAAPNTVPAASEKESKAGATTETSPPKPTESAASSATAPNQPPVKPSAQTQSAAGARLGTAGSGVAEAIAETPSFASRVHKFVLDNGMTVLVMPMKGTGTVAISGRVRAGEFFRVPEKSLAPDLMSDLLTGGSKNFSKEILAEKLEELGSSLTFDLDDFWLSFNSEVTSEDVNSFMPLVADALENPTFADAEIEKCKKLRAAAIKDAMADTGSVAWNRFLQNCYKPTSVYYDKPFAEQLKELDKITAQDLRAYHQAHVIPRNTVIALAGDISPEDGRAAVEKVFRSWTGGPADKIKIDQSAVLSVKGQRSIRQELPDKSNLDVYAGHPIAVAVGDPDYFPTIVGNAALGYDSFACRLSPVRDKYGLTYYIVSSVSAEFPYSPWLVTFSVNPENYQKAMSMVDRIIETYERGGITQNEIKLEKSHLLGAYFVQLRGPKQIAAKICELEILGLGAKYIDEFGDNLAKVTKPQVDACIRKYFSLDDSVISTCGTFKPTPASAQAKDKTGENPAD